MNSKRLILQKLVSTLVIGVPLFVTFGCGANLNKDKTEEGSLALTAALVGAWDGTCSQDSRDIRLGDYYLESYTFNSDLTYKKITRFYKAPKVAEGSIETKPCSEVDGTLSLEEKGTYALHVKNPKGETNTWESGAVHEVDLMIRQYNMEPVAVDKVDSFNVSKTCKSESWKLYKEKNISNRTCWGVKPFRIRNIYTIIKRVEENNVTSIQMGHIPDLLENAQGVDDSALKPEARAQALSSKVFTK